jgi:predicted Zn-dependent protease with MMP-like domain
MRTLLGERFAPVTSSIGYLELPLQEAAEALEAWRRRRHLVTIARPNEGFPEMLRRLEPLTAGARPRELLVGAGKWTAYFDNSLRGTDAVSTIGHLSGTLRCQGLAIRVVPRTVGLPNIRRGRAGSVQFELFGPLPTEFLNYVRTVSVAFDGSRWVFNANGTEQAFEELGAYEGRRVRDRFTSQMLERYCNALGLDVFNPHAYGPEAVFFESSVVMPAEGN